MQGQHLVGEVKLHMSGAALHSGQDLRGGGACDGMDLLYLVHLIGSRKQWKQTNDLCTRYLSIASTCCWQWDAEPLSLC